MRNKIIFFFLFVMLIGLTSAIPLCLDDNQQDISKMPCSGFTVPVNCTGNVTAFNISNVDINYTFETDIFFDGVLNFTLDLPNGEYQLFDCENNTASFVVGIIEQGYGVNLFGIIFPSILLTMISLFVSGKLFGKYKEHDEEHHMELKEEGDEDSFMPKSRLIPVVFMLFSFIPMIFMVGFVNLHLEQYLTGDKITTFYGIFYILFSYIFYFVFLISFIVWASSFIKMRRVMRGLDSID